MKNRLLRKIVKHAYMTVPYYNEVFDKYGIDPLSINTVDDLVKIPLLTKEQIQNSPDRFVSSDYQYFPKSNDIIIRRTSGSTGKFMKIQWSRHDDIRSMFHLYGMRKKYYGIDVSDRFCSFHTTIYNNNKLREAPETIIGYGGKNLSFSKLKLNNNRIADYYQQIIEFKPKWLLLQPSLAYLLAQYVVDSKSEVPHTIKYIELTGEYLFNNVRDKLKEVFNVPIANQYGCNEINSIAYECPHGNLHCHINNVIVEIVKDGKKLNDGEEGEIYITGLTNTAMPFIRYALGDIGSIDTDIQCECGNRNPVIRLSAGRVSQFIKTKEGGQRNSYVFLYPIEKINSNMGNPITQFQIVQTDINKFTVYMIVKTSFKGWQNTIKKEFIEACSEIGFAEAEWVFEFVDNILPDSYSGKMNFFINEIN